MTRWHSISSGRINLEHTGHFRPWTRRWRTSEKIGKKKRRRWATIVGGWKSEWRWNTVKDPSDPVHRDHSLGLVLVETRAHYNSHNRPDITSAVSRSPARRSSSEPHPSLSAHGLRCRRHALSFFSRFVLIFHADSKFTQVPLVSSGYHRLWYAVTGPTTPATRVKTNAPCPTRESSPRTNSVRGALAVARPNLAFFAALARN